MRDIGDEQQQLIQLFADLPVLGFVVLDALREFLEVFVKLRYVFARSLFLGDFLALDIALVL
jgi:hypothetical protein